MTLRLVWIELGELITLSKLVQQSDKKNLTDLSSEIKEKIETFVRIVTNTGAWDTRTLISALSELGEDFMVFSGGDLKDGAFITLEETLENLNKFEEHVPKFFSSVINRHFGDQQQLVKPSFSRDKLLDFLQSQKVLSRFSTWFLTQLLIFPEHTKEIFKETLRELLNMYTESGLRTVVTFTAHDTMKKLKRNHLESALIEYLKSSSKEPISSHIILSIQHLLPGFVSAPVKLEEGTLFLAGDIQKSFELSELSLETDLLKNFLKNLSDQTRFCILKALSGKPMYVAQLASHCGLSKATISHHLTALGRLGILEKKNDGKKVYYSLNRDNLRRIIKNIERVFSKEGEKEWK
ncbi:ArsR/SmtB family transcription factor [Kosmotoga pacifica]|uniref:HTH arsR-type domain-containing protein n=1 Tax=Kosmotoga pacifica TaxID=1330330 RepID=A0A0G2ZCF9_9BACT|nr:metalloregulator ArsR/SmtB family transcription factor [Kosmotoga pacifica]AKI97234.1 hypothetical protein IX53_04745 [Kosmotoga pacifica]